jgi:NADH-quinone oxidoreductase subunit H
MGLIVMSVLVCAGSFNFSTIVSAQEDIFFCVPLFPLFIMFFISALAETNRPPFDLPEAENELVAGYFVEYGGAGFALFFIAETANIILMSFLTAIYFCGGWQPILSFFNPSIFWLALKVLFFCFLFVWVRASLPRYRYDQLMFLGWKVFLPCSIALLFFVISILYFFGGLPLGVILFL